MNVKNNTYKMKNLVEISALVTQSLDFFNIKDKIIEKMLEVVHPAKACVNLFYKNNYEHAYLVCSQTLETIPNIFPINNVRGVKIDFGTYPKYIHEAVKEKKVVYVKNVFEDERAIDERDLAKKEGYIGRIVFPLVINNNVVGFMTCFLTSEDHLSEEDIDFISSVSSLISLSIDISLKNNNTQMLVHKLRGGIASINEATQKLYLNKNIKDKIIEKMLEVVHPAKACVNLFYKNNYEHAYLVCSQTLETIPNIFPINNVRGVKIDFGTYPKYIHEAVKEKKIVYVKNVFEDESAIDERDLAKKEGYVGRIVFPLVINNNVVGFMTCFLTSQDYLSEEDIDFISSVSSLISLSIDISLKNNNTQMLVHKLRGGIASINEATQKLYLNKNIKEFLEHLSKQACDITNSKESIIFINKLENKVFNFYSSEAKNQTKIYPMIKSILAKEPMGAYFNHVENEERKDIEKYIYYKLKDKNEIIGCIACANSQNYTEDDLNIMSILAKQVSVAMQLYEYNEMNVKHKVLANELNILNQQQKLIMDGSNMEWNNSKELGAYHKPARVVGGDFYHAVKVDEDNVVYIVADVMGHGIVSNYVVAMIKGAFKVLVNQYDKPSEIISNLNQMLYDDFDKMGVFTTGIVGKINITNNELTMSNAGHYNPIIINKSGEVDSDLTNIKGMPIGIMRDSDYEDITISIDECPMVLMYTDGILEVKNKNREEYGTKRLENFIKSNYRFTKESIIENLKRELKEFTEKEQYEDDILAVMIKSK